eukprot:1142832-Pelagomonas_calceolata.AAC.7
MSLIQQRLTDFTIILGLSRRLCGVVALLSGCSCARESWQQINPCTWCYFLAGACTQSAALGKHSHRRPN